MDRELRGRIALVTGGTDGVGKEIARGLARLGINVIVVGRDAAKGARTIEGIRVEIGGAGIEFLSADLSRMSEAERLASSLAGRLTSLHYLVHSAGVVRGHYELTPEGIESNFATNYLSRFVLTNRLLPLLDAGGRKSQTSRIVLVSGAATNGPIHWNDVNLTKRFNTVRVVRQFCQANDLFTVEMAERLRVTTEGRVTITSLKLGVVKTNIRREFPGWMKLLVLLAFDPLLGQTPQEAAAPALQLLLSKEFESLTGRLFMQVRKFKELRLPKSLLDQEARRRFWDLSERLSGWAATASSTCSARMK